MGKKEILVMSVFQLIRMIVIVPLTCIQVKEGSRKTDRVKFVNLCTVNTMFT